ncbi:MAG: hypothetical protein ACTSUJ_05420 [Candidatus Njordarchaeales archaeon]
MKSVKLKELGISIDRNLFLRNPDLAYELHLEAMKIELDYVRRKTFRHIKTNETA